MGNKVNRATLGDAVFEDKSLAVCEHGLEVKWYYFPAANSKFVKFSELAGAEKALRDKDWGIGISGVWWPSGFGTDMGIKLYFKEKKVFGCGISIEDPSRVDEILQMITDRIERSNESKAAAVVSDE